MVTKISELPFETPEEKDAFDFIERVQGISRHAEPLDPKKIKPDVLYILDSVGYTETPNPIK